MNMTEIFSQAAADVAAASEYNKDRKPSLRPSRAGLPLLVLFLEDIVTPLLGLSTEPRYKQDPFASTMRLSTGYLFEQCVGQYLRQQYPDNEILGQVALDTIVGPGTCDFLNINTNEKRIQVVECKALKASSVSEVTYNKLTDNWGYLTQLNVYIHAAMEKYPEYAVDGVWYVWMKQPEKHTQKKLKFDLRLHNRTLQKREHYAILKEKFTEGNLKEAVEYVLDYSEDVPQREYGDGYYKGTCSFHYHPCSDFILKNDGSLVDNVSSVMLELLQNAHKKLTTLNGETTHAS